MQVANDAYQYSWGCALFDGKTSIRVQTRTPKYVMLDRPVGGVTSERREPVKVFAPDLEIAQKRVRTDRDRVAQIARPSHDVSLAKSQYLDTLDRYYTSDECDEKEMREVSIRAIPMSEARWCEFRYFDGTEARDHLRH